MSLAEALGTARPSIEQREMIMTALGYEPWPEQADFHFDVDPETGEERRLKVVTGGEQAGKSFSAAMEMMTKLFWGKIFWIVGPDYSQCKNEFNYLQGWLERLGLLAGTPNKPDKGGWRMRTLLGQTITTKSAQDVATIAGEAPDGILFVEAGQAPYEAFLRCYGRTMPKAEAGSWLCVNGTFEKDTGAWLRNLWKAAQTPSPAVFSRIKSFSIPSYANRTFYPQGIDTPSVREAKATLDEDHFNERFGGIPSAPRGIVHPEFNYTVHVRTVKREGTMKDWELNPGDHEIFQEDGSVCLPVDTVDEVWIDPGFQHAYAALFVTVLADCAFVYDELYFSGRHSEQMADMALAHPRWKHVGRLVMDISGQGNQGGNKAAALVWKDKTGLMPISRLVKVADGIERVRVSLSANPESGYPQLVLDPNCSKTAWEFSEGYRYPTDRWGAVLASDKPEDANNDAVKAIVYGLTLSFGPAKRSVRNRAQLRKDRDKTGGGRTVGGWELLYDGNHIAEVDPADRPYEEDDDSDGYDPSYEDWTED